MSVDTVVQALAPGGVALFGTSQRLETETFFSGAAGQAYHLAFSAAAFRPRATTTRCIPARSTTVCCWA